MIVSPLRITPKLFETAESLSLRSLAEVFMRANGAPRPPIRPESPYGSMGAAWSPVGPPRGTSGTRGLAAKKEDPWGPMKESTGNFRIIETFRRNQNILIYSRGVKKTIKLIKKTANLNVKKISNIKLN